MARGIGEEVKWQMGMITPGGRMAAPRELLRPFLFAAVAYLVLALLLGLALAVLLLFERQPPFGLRFAHVHLVLLGSVSQAMLGAMPFFAMALLATLPPDPALVRWQWWMANAGVVALAVGAIGEWRPLTLLGGALFFGATVLVGWIIAGMTRRALVGRRLDVWYYLAAALFGLLGMLAGLLLLSDQGQWLGRGLRLAHLHLTLVGWVSLTIVGTMHTFFPTVVGAPSGGQRQFAVTFGLFAGGVLALAAGLLWLTPLATAGGLAIAAGAVVFGADVVRARRARRERLTLAGAHLFGAALYFVLTCLGGLLLLSWMASGRSVDLRWLVAYAHVGLVGWIIQTLVGAMVHLLPVMAGGGALGGGRAPGTAAAATRYDEWRGHMEENARWQFWLLNGGLVLFALAFVSAPVFSAWTVPMIAGGLAMLTGLAIFARKGLDLYLALRRHGR